jgi:hypothetical protein
LLVLVTVIVVASAVMLAASPWLIVERRLRRHGDGLQSRSAGQRPVAERGDQSGR